MGDLKKSFTLIELAVVLVLFVLLCSITIPHFWNSSRYAVQAELEKIESIFSYLQQSAIATNSDQKLLLNLKNNSFSFLRRRKLVTIKLLSSIRYGFIKEALGPPGKPNKAISHPISFPKYKDKHQVTFLPSGQISTGSLYLVGKRAKNMGALTCSVSQISYVRKYLYQNNRWCIVA